VSTPLDDDGRAAYHRFRLQARALARISRSFDDLATAATAAYAAALSDADAAAWTTLVVRIADLLRHASERNGIVHFERAERDALAYFAAIVRENDDLLPRMRAVGMK